MVEQGFGWQRARVWMTLWAALAVALVAGCATMGGLTKESSPEAKRAAVTERVNARWAALIDGDLDLAYTFLSPASKEMESLAAYKRVARGSGFREIKVESVDCEGAVCSVQLMVTYDTRQMKGIMTPLAEKWVIDEGQAWYVWN